MSTAEFTLKVPDLIVMRHSKSAYPSGVTDHDRPLSDRGERDVRAARQWFHQQAFAIDQVWVSSAVRAQQTWAGIESGVRSTADPEQATMPELYEASVDTLVSLLCMSTADRLLVVAHNPGLEQLIEHITRHDPHGWLAQISMKFPTGAICVLRRERWDTFRGGDTEILDYAVPRAS